jgi:5'-nucleotidase
MKILISNDDGVFADGIRCLHKTLKQTHDTTVVAPLEERSTTGHTLSLDNPLRVVEIEDGVYGCSGYPADCTLVGFGHLLKDNKPDVIVSGINRGANLGQDIYYSGTMAAAREAVFHGIPAIAVSTALDLSIAHHENVFYQSAADFVAKLLKEDITNLLAPMHVINVNVPNIEMAQIKGAKLCTLGFRNYSEDISCRRDFRDRDYFWVGGVYKGFTGDDKTDCFAVENKYISVSIINLLGGETEKINEWKNLIEKL